MPSAEEVAQYEAHLENCVIPLLDKYDAKITNRNWGFYDFITILFRNEKIDLSVSDVGSTKLIGLRFFLSRYDEIVEVLRSLDNVSDPFYSDISLTLENKFGKRNIANGRSTIAYQYICNKIRESGRRIWS